MCRFELIEIVQGIVSRSHALTLLACGPTSWQVICSAYGIICQASRVICQASRVIDEACGHTCSA